jgi:hypothetical protein
MKYLLFIMLLMPISCFATSYQPLEEYQAEWCAKNGGKIDYVYENDTSNVACIKDQYAIYTAYASKWKEAVGQALYYSVMTGKKPGVALIVPNTAEDTKNFKNLKQVADKYNIRVWEIK